MDIIAESLSVQQFDVSTGMTVNGLDIVDYIESKLSTGVEFIGGYSDISLAPTKNGYIAVVGTKEYIYSETQSKWIQIGDETLYGQIVDYLDNASNYALKSELSDYVKEDALTAYVVTDVLSDYTLSADLTAYSKKEDLDILSDYVLSNALTSYAQLSDLNEHELSAEAGSMAYEDKGNYLTAIPEGYVTDDNLTAYAKMTDLSDISGMKADIAYLGTVSSDCQLSAAAGSMAYEDKGNYLTAVPEGYATTSELSDYAKTSALANYPTTSQMTSYVNDQLTGSAEIDLTDYAKKTELSDIPSMKANIEYLGTLSSEYSLSANAGNLAYKNIEDLEIPTDSSGLSATAKDLSTALGLNYKSYESTSANSLTSNVGAYSGFQLKLSAFSDAKICSFDFYRPSGTYGAATGTKLSVVGSSSSTFAGVNADNTYIVSDGTATYPAENAPYTAKMKYTDKAIPLDLSTLFFYFVNSATNAQVNVRFNVYGNYTTGTVATFLHGQSGWFVQLTANTVTTSLAGYVTPSQMESYVASHSGVSEEVDPKFAVLSSQFLTQQSLDGYATTSSLTSYAEISALTAYAQLSDLNEHELSAEAGSMAYEDKSNYLTAVPEGYMTDDDLTEYAKMTDLSDISGMKADIAYLGTVSSDCQLSAAAGSMAYEDKGNYLTAVPEGYARTTELSDIPTIKANIQYLGTLSSTYALSAEAGKLAYMDPEDLPTPSSGSMPTNYLSIDEGVCNEISSVNNFYNAAIFAHISEQQSSYRVAFGGALSAHATIDGVRYIVPDDSNQADKPLGKNIPDSAISVNTYDGPGDTVGEDSGELIATRRWTDRNFLKTSGGTLTGDVDLYQSQLSVDSFSQIIDVSERKSLQAVLNEKQDSLLKEPVPVVGPSDRVMASRAFYSGVSLSTALVASGSTYNLYYPTISADATIATTDDLTAFITQDDLTATGEAKAFYDLAEATASANEIHLSANAVNIYAPTADKAGTTLSVYMPNQISGYARDSLLRLDQTAVATSLSIVLVGGTFESEDGEFPEPEANAVNIFSFVETAPNVFDISRKTVKGIN